MTTFILDTDSVSSAKSALDNLENQVNNIVSDVNGYDTSCDEFDFSSPKSVIAGNIEACGTKIKNTSSYINAVINSHTSLQNSMKFESTEEKMAKAQEEAMMRESTAYAGNHSNGGSYSGGSSCSGGNGYSSGASYAGGGSYSSGGEYYSSGYSSSNNQSNPVTVVNATISDVKHEKVETANLTEKAKAISEKSEYNEAGFATYGGMLLIACSTVIGKVGDIVEFTMNDGSTKRCLVLENIEGDEIKFFVNNEWKEDNEANQTANFKDNVKKIENYGNYQESTGLVDLTNLPAIGEHTSKWSALGDEWTVVSTKISVPDYEKVVANNRITQDSNSSRYGDYCLAFSYVHASNMYNGYTGDTAVDAGNYKHASEFNSFYSNNKTDVLNKIYSEIVQGKPVVLQVNGNTSGTSRHFITVVGFRNSVTDPGQLTEDDLLIMDSWDGKIERMDQSNSRFITTGSQTGHGNEYSGYYLRTLK